jgi:hypothetical protein
MTQRVKRPATKKKIRVIIETILELDSDEFSEIDEVVRIGRERGNSEIVDISIVETTK